MHSDFLVVAVRKKPWHVLDLLPRNISVICFRLAGHLSPYVVDPLAPLFQVSHYHLNQILAVLPSDTEVYAQMALLPASLSCPTVSTVLLPFIAC